jgi:hypothetical protein
MPPNKPATSFKFNSFQEIKSHSSILYNERMAILFYLLDMKSIEMNTYFRVENVLEVRGIVKQIYKNMRMLLRNNPTARATLNLDTKDDGIYTTDIAIATVDKMIEYCEGFNYTIKRIHILIQELNNIEMIIKDVLQYYHYFIRPDFKQKPDIEIATERYKEIADKATIEELKAIVGKKHLVDFEGLGSSRIELMEPANFIDEEEQDEVAHN